MIATLCITIWRAPHQRLPLRSGFHDLFRLGELTRRHESPLSRGVKRRTQDAPVHLSLIGIQPYALARRPPCVGRSTHRSLSAIPRSTRQARRTRHCAERRIATCSLKMSLRKLCSRSQWALAAQWQGEQFDLSFTRGRVSFGLHFLTLVCLPDLNWNTRFLPPLHDDG
jgi:hypothetical protein